MKTKTNVKAGEGPACPAAPEGQKLADRDYKNGTLVCVYVDK